MVSYKPLRHLLITRGMTVTELRRAIKASSSTFAKLQRGEYISLAVVERICRALGCGAGDVIEFLDDDTPPDDTAAKERGVKT